MDNLVLNAFTCSIMELILNSKGGQNSIIHWRIRGGGGRSLSLNSFIFRQFWQKSCLENDGPEEHLNVVLDMYE